MSSQENKGYIICPITGVVNLLSRKWILSILKDLFQGKKHFNEFKKDKSGLSNVVLSDTLKYLKAHKIITKKTEISNSQKYTEYILTEKGLKLGKILYEMTLYGLDELDCVILSESEKEKIRQEYKQLFNRKYV